MKISLSKILNLLSLWSYPVAMACMITLVLSILLAGPDGKILVRFNTLGEMYYELVMILLGIIGFTIVFFRHLREYAVKKAKEGNQ